MDSPLTFLSMQKWQFFRQKCLQKGRGLFGGQNPLNSIWQAPKEGVCFFTCGLCAITHHINFLSPGSCRVEHILLKYHLQPCFIQPYKIYSSFSGVCINRFPFCIDMTCRRQLLIIEPNILAQVAYCHRKMTWKDKNLQVWSWRGDRKILKYRDYISSFLGCH